MANRQKELVALEDRRKAAIASLKEAGLSIPVWAKANGFSPAIVKSVLYGPSTGVRGEAHKVAVALGIKDGVVVPPKGFRPVKRALAPLRVVSGV